MEHHTSTMRSITDCGPKDLDEICGIINDSASAYRGVIPEDRWHEPYMPMSELRSEIEKGIRFYGYRVDGRLVGVMGIQDVKDVTLIRHAYVRSSYRGRGIGKELLNHLVDLTDRPILIGTWRAATWAIQFYQTNGFSMVPPREKDRLLQTYWTIPRRQVEESVVLANSRWQAKA
jgi:GNAT superfamily N-acetyltransferase